MRFLTKSSFVLCSSCRLCTKICVKTTKWRFHSVSHCLPERFLAVQLLELKTKMPSCKIVSGIIMFLAFKNSKGCASCAGSLTNIYQLTVQFKVIKSYPFICIESETFQDCLKWLAGVSSFQQDYFI